MKLIGIRDAKQGLSGILEEAQEEKVLLTRHGRPIALVIGVEGQDMEDMMTASDPAFWKWVRKRRQQAATMTLAEVEARFAKDRVTTKASKPPARKARRGRAE
jgi:prevent-host-death family protein